MTLAAFLALMDKRPAQNAWEMPRWGGGFCCYVPPDARFPILLPGSVRTVLKSL